MGRVRLVLAASSLAACLLTGSAVRADAPASGEPTITATGTEGDFLRAIHAQVHLRWTRFLDELKGRPANDPLNNPKLTTEVLFTVRWDGSPSQFTVSQASGVAAFDQAAVAAIKGTGARYPIPPIDLYADDGVVHVRWVLARDQRLCGVGEVRRFEAPLKDALPRLFVQGRTKEALLRVVRYNRNGDATAVSEFARAYLARPFPDQTVDLRAAAALARAGDARQANRLKPGLNRVDTVPLVAPALAAIKVDVCALVAPRLTPGNPEAPLATLALRSAGELPPTSPCVEAISGIEKNDAVPAAERAEMLETLAVLTPGNVRKQALAAIGDSDAKLRVAGAQAFARPGGGRPSLYRLQPLLADPSADVRAAAAAGMVRACGDLANPYVLPLFKGRDAEPLAAMAPELGKASSPASADLLAKMQKRPEPELKLPVLAALANRQDPAGKALYEPLAQAIKKDPYASPEARRIVYTRADADELKAMAAKDPALGLPAYKALLRAGRSQEALDWLVANFDRSSPETLVEALGAWLATPAGQAAKPAATK
jgi:hypothetical protein